MIKASRLQVSSTPVNVMAGESIDSITGQTLVLRNSSTHETVYLGGADVDVYQGFPVYAGEQLTVEFLQSQQLYAVAVSSAELSVLWMDIN